MTVPETVMLFAAGLGSRMRPLTDTCPKPLLQVAGRRLLDHALAETDVPWVQKRVINTHYLAPLVERAAAETGLIVSHEEELLDTGGGLKAALPHVGSPACVFTLNCDAVWAGPSVLGTLAQAWDPDKMDALLLLCPPQRMVAHSLTSGFAMDVQGRLSWDAQNAYTGAQILKTEAVLRNPNTVFSVRQAWDDARHKGRLFGVMYDGYWADVGHPAGIAAAEDMVARHV